MAPSFGNVSLILDVLLTNVTAKPTIQYSCSVGYTDTSYNVLTHWRIQPIIYSLPMFGKQTLSYRVSCYWLSRDINCLH